MLKPSWHGCGRLVLSIRIAVGSGVLLGACRAKPIQAPRPERSHGWCESRSWRSVFPEHCVVTECGNGAQGFAESSGPAPRLLITSVRRTEVEIGTTL